MSQQRPSRRKPEEGDATPAPKPPPAVGELAPVYDPQQVEQRLYRWWEERGFFTPTIDRNKKPFVIIMPPPNVTGELHLGHALTTTVEDILTRWHRMRGEPTLWLPGTDHAGIATQYVVERVLAQEEHGLDRRGLGRERFEDRVWEWVRKYGGSIQNQLRRLGASCDWTRARFTLDPGPSRAVRTTFVNLWDKKRLYRGERIINWCPRCATVLSDLETEYEDAQGALWHIRYPYADGSGRSVTVATTRPETLLGDTAVAVNPGDARYRDVVGQTVLLPVINKAIPIIADEYVDTSFGTGALKITPAHDPNDFEIGARHGLPRVNVINPDATMNANAGPYAGLDRFECRKRIVEDLERFGLLVKVEPYQNRVGHCYRCKTIVEPAVSIQWFVEMKPLAERAAQAARDEKVRFVPDRFQGVYLNWMENIRDWCISRQLWWGHRIPAWYCASCDGARLRVILRAPFVSADGSAVREGMYVDLKLWGLSHQDLLSQADRIEAGQDAVPIVSSDQPEACPRCGGHDLIQDPDVLDTWFSSALWPHSTLGWAWKPEDWPTFDLYEAQKNDVDYFYPTSVMETGYDILFFWVARMVMMGLENTDEAPFHTVYLHGLVRDAQRQKMSKTRGNVIDPLDTIKEYGTDALRMALTISTTAGTDLSLTPARLEAGRNFANKLWNAARFVLRSIEDPSQSPLPLGEGWGEGIPAPVHREDRWIVSRLHRTTAQATRLLEDYQLGQAEQDLRDFVWDDFCDWYIELAKIRLRAGDKTPLPYLVGVLETSLRLLHPYMPFITEEIWQALAARVPGLAKDRPALIVSAYPQADPDLLDGVAEREMSDVIEIVRAIRNVRAERKVQPNQPIEALVDAGATREAVQSESSAIRALARVEPLSVLESSEPRPEPSSMTTVVLGAVTVMVPIADLLKTGDEPHRLQTELEDALARIKSLEERLANPSFRSRAPAEIVAKEEAKLSEARERRARLEEQLARIS